MSIKQNFPTIDSTLNLDFANSRVVDSRITFTRASAATHTDANGIIQTVRDNKPRIDFNASTGECRGLLIEEQRTNLIKSSNNVTVSPWQGIDFTKTQANAGVSPSGNFDANLVTVGTNAGALYQDVTGLPAGTSYAVSFYIKKITETGTLVVRNTQDGSYGRWDINLSLIPSNQWVRITSTHPSVVIAGNFVAAPNGYCSPAYFGSGTIQFYLWGTQLEAGTFPTSYVPSVPTFTSRASSATYFDATGVLRTAPVNGARYGFGYDSTTQKWVSQGLILEAATTNLFPTSLMSAFAAVQNMDIVSTSIAAIDGTVGNVFKLTPTTANTSMHSIFRNLASSTPSTRCVSVYLKAAGYNYARIYCDGTDPTTGGVIYDLSTGTTSIHSSYAGANRVAYGMENVGNGWYRCWVSGTATNADWYYHIDVADTAAFGSFAGNGSSGVYAWGPQMEIGSVPTSYISTSGSTVTRAADVSSSATTTRSRDNAEMYNIDQSWFKNSEGSFYAEGYYSATNSSSLLAVVPGITDTWTASMMQLSEFNAGSTSGFRIYTSINGATATGQIDPGVTTLSTGVNHKFAGAWRTNDAASSVNTTAISTDNTVILPGNLSTLKIGSSYASGIKINGCIKKITYYPVRLSNTQLQALTV